jgi:hypothetical protein
VFTSNMGLILEIMLSLILTLEDHAERQNLDKRSLTEQVNAINDVIFIMSVYGTEYGVDKGAALIFLEAMVPNTNTDALRRVRRALLFVEAHYDRLSVLVGAVMKGCDGSGGTSFCAVTAGVRGRGMNVCTRRYPHCQCSFLYLFFILLAHNH